MPDVKITVLEKLKSKKIFKEYATEDVKEECEEIEVGDEYLVEGDELGMPEGFCPWAWADIQRDVVTLALDGDFPWIKEDGTAISACTDGLRPVIFKLQRIEG